MALDIPTVMSPVGMNVELASGGAARLADSPEDWRRELSELIQDPDLRIRIGEAGRQRVLERYSVEANVGAWAAAIKEACA